MWLVLSLIWTGVVAYFGYIHAPYAPLDVSASDPATVEALRAATGKHAIMYGPARCRSAGDCADLQAPPLPPDLRLVPLSSAGQTRPRTKHDRPPYQRSETRRRTLSRRPSGRVRSANSSASSRRARTFRVFIEAARARREALDHVLFVGPPGSRQDHAGADRVARTRRRTSARPPAR